MQSYQVILWLFVMGLVGGLLNAYLSDGGFLMPQMDRLANGQRIWRPGFPGNALIGGVTAVIMAVFYGPLGAADLAGAAKLDLRTLAGALLSGIGGARLLTQEVSRRYGESVKTETNEAIRNLTSSKD